MSDETQDPVDQVAVATQATPVEEPSAWREELERLQEAVLERDERLQELQASLAVLRRESEFHRELAQEREAELRAHQGALDETQVRLQEAVARYRAALLAGHPEIPEEMVRGDTVAELEASLEAARGVVEAVRSRLSHQLAAERVPAGAPPRTPPDLSGLSPREKIAHGLAQRP